MATAISETISSLPSVAAAATESTLNAALKAVGLSHEAAGSAEGNPAAAAVAEGESPEKKEKEQAGETTLEDGEVEQSQDEKNGAVGLLNGKTVLHDAANFDVKVGRLLSLGVRNRSNAFN